MLNISIHNNYDFNDLITTFDEYDYSRVSLVLAPGDYSVRGSIIDIFPGNRNLPVRIEFFDDEVDDMRTFEPNTQRSLAKITEIDIHPLSDEQKKKAEDFFIPHEILFDLNAGDYVIHIVHGVGLYKGLERMTMKGNESEYAVVEFTEQDVIYVPIEQLNRLHRHTSGTTPTVSSLRDNKWQAVKKRVQKAVQNVAKELFSLYKRRRIKEGYAYGEDTELDIELAESFPYQETTDQLKAIEAIKQDMEKPLAMDRLICGDVGFGKTEVAIRAALKAVCGQKQVAILAPTTILAKQHYKVFHERLEPLAVRVDFVSRFKTPKEQKETLQRVADGKIDVIIGTHRLLQKDVMFKDIGLLIIDEEQRFGVMAKEKLKQARSTLDVLTLSATPLPRTLYLSISGIRDVSVINTPPLERLPIITHSNKFKLSYIKEKIEKELARGGQIYFLHNRVFDIYHIQGKLKTILPDLDVRVVHGQMKSKELDQIIMDFYENKFPVLLSTTIIENGVDIPNVNSIFINHADKFGLSQLHQIRGRVGRNKVQSHAYLLYPDESRLTEDAHDRFEALKHFSTLGSGYDISLRDLELRGIGNILGTEQSGYMEAIGFELYMHLLNKAIAEEKGEAYQDKSLWEMSKYDKSSIDEEYIPDMNIRLAVYKGIADLGSRDDVDNLVQELLDRFGPLPENLEGMLSVIRDSCKD